MEIQVGTSDVMFCGLFMVGDGSDVSGQWDETDAPSSGWGNGGQ